MPTSYECKTCNLAFSVGWFHYHSFSTGYGSKTLLACKLYGTQHAIEISLPDRGPEYHEVFKISVERMSKEGFKEVVQQLRRHKKMSLLAAKDYVQNTPFTLIERGTDSHVNRMCPKLRELGIVVNHEVIERIKNPGFGSIQKDRLLYFSEPYFKGREHVWAISDVAPEIIEKGLSNLQCQSCGNTGCLVDDKIAHTRCPRCENNELTVASQWIT